MLFVPKNTELSRSKRCLLLQRQQGALPILRLVYCFQHSYFSSFAVLLLLCPKGWNTAERVRWAADSQFCLSAWKCNAVSAELPYWRLATWFCSASPGKCPKCAMVAKEMLGEAEMTCSFEKQWFEGWERRSMCALPLHTVDLSMWSLLSLPLLWGHEKNLCLEWRQPFCSPQPAPAPLCHAHWLSQLTEPVWTVKLMYVT